MDEVSRSTYSAIANIILYFTSLKYTTAGNIISAIQLITGTEGNTNKSYTAKTMISYQYFYNDGEVYTPSGWILFYRTGRRYTYKHEWAAYTDWGGTMRQGTKDYTPQNGYGPIETYTSPNYSNDSYIRTTARDRYLAGLDPYYEYSW